MDEFRTGYGAVWLDLLATQKGRRGGDRHEFLTDPAAARRWLRSVRLDPLRTPDRDDFVHLVELRESLYVIARAAVAKDGRPAAAAVRVLNDALAADVALQVSATASGVAPARPATGSAAIARIARQAADQLTGPERARLRPCGDDECGGIFLDESGRRRWCADATCGSRSRVRAHRARARTQ